MANNPKLREVSKATQIKKGQVLNPNGRPRKLFSDVLLELSKVGHGRVSNTQVAEAYEILIALKEKELIEWTNDKDRPMLLRIVGKALLSGKGFENIERILDRVHGKAIQKNEHTGKDGGAIEIKEYLLPSKKKQ
jgi:hypothetical protein